MEAWLLSWVHALLQALALPKVGLSAIFAVAFVSATLLPMGSEPAVYALVHWQPHMFWPAVLVATAGNTLGGALSWWMGAGADALRTRWRRVRADGMKVPAGMPAPAPAPAQQPDRWSRQALAWLERFGPKACLLSWLPLVGDPLCAVAGWLRLPFWPCVAYMAVGKFLRYAMATGFLIWIT